MLIVCPSCSSEYAIDPDRIGPSGRKVRCAGCRETWFVMAEESGKAKGDDPGRQGTPAGEESIPKASGSVIDGEAAPLGDRRSRDLGPGGRGRARPARSGAARPRSPDRPRRAVPGRAARWGLRAAALLAVLAIPSALAFRAPLVRAAPESAALFAAIGLPVNLLGLELTDVSSSLASEDGRPVLVVEGAIANASARPTPVPALDMKVESASGDMLYTWSAKPPKGELAPGEATRFRFRLASPPPEGKRVLVTFGRARDATVASR
jgi:predicted Zn finger-like uncharacterized protein